MNANEREWGDGCAVDPPPGPAYSRFSRFLRTDRFARWVRLAAGLAAAAALAGCGERVGPVVEVTGPTMGTYYAVKVARPPAGLGETTVRSGIEAVLAEVNREISTYDPGSELSRLNANPSTDWIAVSPELLAVLQEGVRIGALSGGAFDVTVGPLVNLWGFGPGRGEDRVPAPESIRAALERVGADKLTLRDDPPAVRKARGDVYIDLSALGEGYGADRMAAWLESQGATDYMAAVAGTMRVKGSNARGRPWGIAIERPLPGERSVQRVLPVSEGAVSTSGDYRNFFESGGRRYSHHIDPHTGESVAHSLASASVVTAGGPASAMRADGLATALIVLGEERGPALAEREGLAAFFIVREDAGFREIATPALERLAREGDGAAHERQ